MQKVERGKVMKKFLAFVLALVMCLGLCACGEKSTIVEITEENWADYFELSSESNELVITDVVKNDFDEIDWVDALDSFVLKDGYTLGKDGFELKVGYDALSTQHECKLDLENNKVLLVKLIDEGDPEHGVSSETSTVTDERPTFGFYVQLSPKYESSEIFTHKYTITRIEGTLSLVEE